MTQPNAYGPAQGVVDETGSLDLSDLDQDACFRSDHMIAWSNSLADCLTQDTHIKRSAAGILEVGKGTAGVLGAILVEAASGGVYFGGTGASNARLRGSGANLVLEKGDGSGESFLTAAGLLVGLTQTLTLAGTTLDFNSSGAVKWSPGASPGASPDIGLARESAGILKVTDGGAGHGTLRVGDSLIVGTVADPGSPGDINVGLSGSFRFTYDQSSGSIVMYDAAGIQRINLSAGQLLVKDGSGINRAQFSAAGGTQEQIILTSAASVEDMAFDGLARRVVWGNEMQARQPGVGINEIDFNIHARGTGGLGIAVAEELLQNVSGASVSTTNLVEAGGRLLGVLVRNEVAIGTTGGTTGYDVGDGTDQDLYAANIGTGAGAASSSGDFTADPESFSTSAQDVTITALGGNFDGTGDIRVVAFFIKFRPFTT